MWKLFSRKETANSSFSALQKQGISLSHEVGAGDADTVGLQARRPACG